MQSLETMLNDQTSRLAPHFRAGFLQRPLTVFQFHFSQGDPFFLTVTETDFSFAPGVSPAPTLSLFIDSHTTCWGLIDGSFDGMRAFMEGRYRADGNIVLSQLLLYLFKSNDATNIYEVQD
ncbi:MAG: SCP-2 family sterol carrier protein [Pseudomonadota bacterium]